MKEPLVSVVVPAYNAERFIERTLRSARRQAHRNLEVIIIDDGSTDNTRALAHAFVASDDRFRIIRVPNGGVANARNIGIEASRGPFVAFLDADDLWHPTKISLQLASLQSGNGRDAAAAYALHRVIDIDDRVISQEAGYICNGYTLAAHMYAKFVGNGSCLLVRRETALAVGGYEPSWAARGLGGCEDLDFELKLSAKHQLVAVPRFLVGYRSYPGNMSSDASRMAQAILETVEHHIRSNPELPRWAATKIRSCTREYALTLLAGQGLWSKVSLQLAHQLQGDPSGAVEFAARLVARKIRKSLRPTKTNAAMTADYGLFDDLSPDSIAELQGRAPRRRDLMNMQRLAKLDAVLASRLGIAGHEVEQPRAGYLPKWNRRRLPRSVEP